MGVVCKVQKNICGLPVGHYHTICMYYSIQDVYKVILKCTFGQGNIVRTYDVVDTFEDLFSFVCLS